jgi:crossover junction endodeoxyribonuclease RusA
MKVVLPFPHTDLSPNSHKHWRIKARAVKDARNTARILTLSAMATIHASMPDFPLELAIVFHPPDKRKRDRDNLIASMKAYQDGIADAMQVDDNTFKVSYEMGTIEPKGKVDVTITYAPLPFSEVAAAQVG